MNQPLLADPKLFMLLLGSKAPNRNVEQHDFFFCIGNSLKDLVPDMKAFWPEAGKSLHLDGWREINQVDDFDIRVVLKSEITELSTKKLFFVNLGGYQHGKLEEQHYTLLSVRDDRIQAIADAKKTIFYKTNTIKGATSHIDDKYGIDVDDIYQIEDILSPELKEKYHILITPAIEVKEDKINLGYFKMDKIK